MKRLLVDRELADVNKRGCLSFEQFVLALRLMAFAQLTLKASPQGTLIDVQKAQVALSNPSFQGVPILQGFPVKISAPQPQQQQQQQQQAPHERRQSGAMLPDLFHGELEPTPQQVILTNTHKHQKLISFHLPH